MFRKQRWESSLFVVRRREIKKWAKAENIGRNRFMGALINL
jgi:hypothetical protein